MSMSADFSDCIDPSNEIATGLRLTLNSLVRSFLQMSEQAITRWARRSDRCEQILITDEHKGRADQDRRSSNGPNATNAHLAGIPKYTRLTWQAALLLLPALALLPLAAAEAKYPDKPIRLVLPFGPGGVSDVTARILADKLSQKLAEQVVVENMPGPGGINATRTVLRAAADGYTLGLFSNGTAISVDMFEHLPFDPVTQFAMVSEIGSFDLLIAVAAQSKYKTLQDLIAAAKAHPATLNIGTISVGSTQNLGAELLRSMSGANMMVVPYKNSPDIVLALLRGDVDAMLDFPPAVAGQANDGKLRIIATSGVKRSPFLQDVPAAAEAGVPGYDVTSWNGIFAPRGTPQDVIDTLNNAIAEAVAMPDVKEKFAKLGVVAQASKPLELMAQLKGDITKWDAVIKKAGIPKR